MNDEVNKNVQDIDLAVALNEIRNEMSSLNSRLAGIPRPYRRWSVAHRLIASISRNLRYHASDFVGVAGFIIGIVIFVFFSLIDSLYSDKNYLTFGSMISILITIGIDRIADKLSQRESEDNLTRRFDRINDNIKSLARDLDNTANCIYRDVTETAIYSIIPKIDVARRVKNTYVQFDLDKGFSYSDRSERDFRNKIQAFLEGDKKRWIDISGPKTDYICNRIEDMAKLNRKSTYMLYRLRSRFPIVNFIILEYGISGDKDTEVFFGWGGHKHDRDGKVFSSTNVDLVSRFQKYFDMLCEKSLSNAFELKPGDDLKRFLGAITRGSESIEGRWIVVAFEEEYGKDDSSVKFKIRDVADVSIEANGEITSIKGELYTESEKFVVGEYESRAVKWDGESLEFMFERKDFRDGMPGQSIGASIYRFSRERPRPMTLGGKFQDARLNREIRVHGSRLNWDELEVLNSLSGQDRVYFIIEKGRSLAGIYDVKTK